MVISKDNQNQSDEKKTGLQIISDVLFLDTEIPDYLPGNEEEQKFLQNVIKKIKELQKQITIIDNQYTHILNLLPEPIIITDNNGIIFANHALLMLIKGNNIDDIIKRRLRDFVDPDRSTVFWEKILQSADFNSAILFPFQSRITDTSLRNNIILDCHPHDHFMEEVRCIDNSVCFVDFNPVVIQKKDYPAILIVMHDYTEEIKTQKIMEKEGIVQIEKNMEQFQILNDQIRNPLTIISAIASLIEDNIAAEKIMQQILTIDDLVTKLDKGWIESEKVRSFLLRHYRHGAEL